MLGVVAMVPALPEDSRLLSLPFGGAVLRALNYDQKEVDMLIEESRRSALGIYSGTAQNLVTEEQESLLEQLGLADDDKDDKDDGASPDDVVVDVDGGDDAPSAADAAAAPPAPAL